MKPPFSYFGGKISLAEQIVALLPPHSHYVEPFAGGLAVLLAKRPSRMETVNDLDGDLVNFWRVLRDRPSDLERACSLTPHSRAEHLLSHDMAGDDLERARRMWVRLTQGRGGNPIPTGWQFKIDPDTGVGAMSVRLSTTVARINPAAVRLATVSLECRPALEVIKDYGGSPGCLIYADPPYLGSARGSPERYACEMRGEDEHRELADALHACRAAVVLSGYGSALYAALYDGWHRHDIETRTGNGASQARTEVLWSNRPFPASEATLFDLEATA